MILFSINFNNVVIIIIKCYVILLYLFCNFSFAQKYDYVWVRGTGALTPQPPEYGTSFMDFKTKPPTITLGKKYPPLINCIACISDSTGKLLFFTNLIQVFNSKENIMLNGNQINVGKVWSNYKDVGYPSIQCAKILPINNDSLFLMIYANLNTDSLYIFNNPVRYAIIDPYFQSNTGKVVAKDVPFHFGKTHTYDLVKHGNGKDWWLLMSDWNVYEDKQYYHQFLINEKGGIDSISSQSFNLNTGLGGFSRINKNGNKYVMYSHGTDFNSLSVFNINRCNGLLEYTKNYIFDKVDNLYLFEISPNGRYVYPNRPGNVYQIDLETGDPYLFVDTIGKYDGYQGACFGFTQLTPHDEIMVLPFLCNPKTINIIHKPDLPGNAADFEQHYIIGPNYAVSSPQFPNYRLGALDGSPCDTIGFINFNDSWQIQYDTLELCVSEIQINSFSKLVLRIYNKKGDNLLEEQYFNQQIKYCLSTTSLIPGEYVYYLWVDDKKVLKGSITKV